MTAYLCRTCGESFNENEAIRQVENRHVIDGQVYTTYEIVCPNCGSDDFEIAEACANCGTTYAKCDLDKGLCDRCASDAAKKLYAYINASDFSEPERAYIKDQLEGII